MTLNTACNVIGCDGPLSEWHDDQHRGTESTDEQLQRRENAEWDLVRAARDLMDFGGPLSAWQTFLLESLTREWGKKDAGTEETAPF